MHQYVIHLPCAALSWIERLIATRNTFSRIMNEQISQTLGFKPETFWSKIEIPAFLPTKLSQTDRTLSFILDENNFL